MASIFIHADDCEMSRVDDSFKCTCGAKPEPYFREKSSSRVGQGSEADTAEGNAPRDLKVALARIEALEAGLKPFAMVPVPANAKPHWAMNYMPTTATYADVTAARALLHPVSTDEQGGSK